MVANSIPMAGGPRLQIVSKDAWVPDPVREMMKHLKVKSELGRFLRECFSANMTAEQAAELIDRLTSTVIVESKLALMVIRGTREGDRRAVRFEPLGVVCRKVVTTAGVGFIVDAFQNSTEVENFKYHALGTGTNSEASGDTALQTELTTEYTANVRATGSLTEGASANIFRTVGTNTLDSGTPAVTEHGVLSASTTGTLLDRSVFSAINLVGANGDGIASTYDLTCSAGG